VQVRSSGVAESPIDQLLGALDQFDLDAVTAQFAADINVLLADGRRAQGLDNARPLMTSFAASLHSMHHDVLAQWQAGEMWFAEVAATYELKDRLELKIPRAVVLERGPTGGIVVLHVYGAHEHLLTDHRTGEEGMWIGGRWVPPL
jgi:hypothetical protein